MILNNTLKLHLDQYHPVIGDEFNDLSSVVIDNDLQLKAEIERLETAILNVNTSAIANALSINNADAIDTIDNEISLINATIASLSTSYQNIVLNNQESFYNLLKLRVSAIELLLSSDSIDLNELQELVDFIKMNRHTLETLTIASIAGLQTALDGKIDDAQVLTDVPAGALFTDTVYVLPNASDSAIGGVKTGTGLLIDADGKVTIESDSHTHTFSTIIGLSDALDSKVDKEQYTASDILFKLKTVDTNNSGLNSSTVNGHTVETDVPVNALFTDTVYVLPVAGTELGGVKNGTDFGINAVGEIIFAKDISIDSIENLREELDAKVDDSQVLTDVPAGALFTDTVYTLPTGALDVIGGVRSGLDIDIDPNGYVSVNNNSHRHLIGNIENLQDVLDSKVDDTQVLTDVPVNALFTDTFRPISNSNTSLDEDISLSLKGANDLNDKIIVAQQSADDAMVEALNHTVILDVLDSTSLTAAPSANIIRELNNHVVTNTTLISELAESFKAVNGYVEIDGIIIQWGSVSVVNDEVKSINYPIAFPVDCQSVSIDSLGSNITGFFNVESKSKNKFTIKSNSIVSELMWFAIGY